MSEQQSAAMATPLSAEQIAAFETHGYVRLREAFAPKVALRLQDRMWAELREDFGIDRDDRRTWWQPMRSLHRVNRDPLQSAVATDRLIGAIGALLGPVRWRVPPNWGLVLVTFPDQKRGDWSLPTSGWHFDAELHRNATSRPALHAITENLGGGG